MFKAIRKTVALLVLTLVATVATAQTVNMSKYITLTVTQGEQIRLRFQAAASATPVKIVSGSTEQTVTVGTSWTGDRNYTAGATTMTVYGDITEFDCADNGTKLTALDVSQNTALIGLYCWGNQLTSLDVSQNTALIGLYCWANQLTSLDVSQNTALANLNCIGNNFTTQAFNDLMCSLPARTAADDAKFYPLWNASDAGYAAFMAANSQIATGKNWQVRYYEGSEAVIPATTGTYICPNMSKYITLTVQQGQPIRLDLKAAAARTPVKIVSGSTNTVVTVGTSWTGYRNYTAGATTMKIYGDITGFDCDGNGTKLTDLNVTTNTALTVLNCRYNRLTALDVSKNTALKTLYCDNNNFTTQAFNELMCSLPARTTAEGARFFPLWNASAANVATFMAANSQIATGKNWQVRYSQSDTEIPATTGTYTCPTLNTSKYITLTVQQGQPIRLGFKAAATGTPVKIVSGSTNTVVTVGTSWTGSQNYTAGATTMTVYGDITEFYCGNNGANLTALDVSKNTALTELNCWGNQLTALDVSKNTALTALVCSENRLTTLDLSKNTALIDLVCNENRLTALDVSKNTALTMLWCYGNNFTTQAFDNLMCSLPARTVAVDGDFFPLDDDSDANAATFMAANSQIAKDKNWHVLYSNEIEIPATTGTYVCPAAGIGEVTSVALALYPNPASDILTIETETIGAAITITDLTGRTVMTATATDGKTTLNISHLSAGSYIVRVGDRVGKIIKE